MLAARNAFSAAFKEAGPKVRPRSAAGYIISDNCALLPSLDRQGSFCIPDTIDHIYVEVNVNA